MAILLDNPLLDISSNVAAPVIFLPLRRGENRIDVVYKEGASGTITPKISKDPSNPDSLSACTEDGSELILTESHAFVQTGPGYLGFVSSGVSGTISVFITR